MRDCARMCLLWSRSRCIWRVFANSPSPKCKRQTSQRFNMWWQLFARFSFSNANIHILHLAWFCKHSTKHILKNFKNIRQNCQKGHFWPPSNVLAFTQSECSLQAWLWHSHIPEARIRKETEIGVSSLGRWMIVLRASCDLHNDCRHLPIPIPGWFQNYLYLPPTG